MARARITYFINSLEQGGAEGQLVALIRALDRDRFEPSLVVCSAQGPEPESLGLDGIHRLGAGVFPSISAMRALERTFRALKPDLVHTFKGYENSFGRWAARRADVPRVVSSLRAPYMPLGHRLAEVRTWPMADAVLVNSVGIQSFMADVLGVAPASMQVIENGVDTERFRRATPHARRAARDRFALGEGFVMLVSARLSPEKSQLEIVEALGSLQRASKLPPGLRVVFAGRDSLWLYGRRVKGRARALGLSDVVRFEGAVREIDALVAASDAVLLPSHFEGLPNAVVEAMASEVPVIVSEAANADALVTDGVEGLVTASHAPASIAHGIERMLSLSAIERESMGKQGRLHAERRFAMPIMVRRTEAVYESLLSASD